LTAVIALSGPDGSRRDEVAVAHCNVVLKDDVMVAAQEAGVLMAVNVHEGDEIDEGTLLATINDTKAAAAKLVAEAEYREAKAQADSDVSVRYSTAAHDVAREEFLLHKEANEDLMKRKGGILYPYAEMLKLRLEWKKAELEIEKAELEQKVAGLTAEAKEASVTAAELDIERRKVKSPITGKVVEVGKQQGEWVNPGDLVVQIIRVDKMKVTGELKFAEVDRSQLHERPVRVVAPLTRGRTEEFEGKVVYVDPGVQAGGVYHVTAEVENRQEGQKWLLSAGIQVEMYVQAAPTAQARAKKRAEREGSRE
jgi:multidrug efflux pump subunit AcrA (membrane-fusion protein)